MLKIHSRKMRLGRDIDLKEIASKMGGASGAESKGAGVFAEAGMFALREHRVHVTQEDFEMAVAKVMQKDCGEERLGGEALRGSRQTSLRWRAVTTRADLAGQKIKNAF